MGTILGTVVTLGTVNSNYSVPKRKKLTKRTIMKATAFLRKVKLKNGIENGVVYFRVRGTNKDFRLASSLTINPEFWDGKVPGYKDDTPPNIVSPVITKHFNRTIQNILLTMQREFTEDADQAWLTGILSRSSNLEELSSAKAQSDKREKKEPTLLDYFAIYLEKAEFHDWHRQAQTSIMHKLQRYEAWLGYINGQPDFRLYLDDFDKEQVEDYKDYMEHKHEYYKANKDFYKQFKLKKSIDIRPVSRNAMICSIKRLNMFLNWCVKMNFLKDTSFRNVTCDQQLYGTPFYLTIEERDKVMNFDLSEFPRLEFHRDKFIFQCLVGCRNNDLSSFTWKNIVDDFLEYIPHKNLLAGRTFLVRVPLCEQAKAILMRIDPDADFLFYKYCEDLYRMDIKRILKMAGIDRTVLYYNQQKRQAEPRPLHEVAASHLARCTFIGNLYKQVQDPALIASLTGHTESSTSFSRYREIDDEIKRNILNLID